MEWQTIDTAPKDGSRILLSRNWKESMAVCWWSEIDEEWIPVAGSIFTDATHWMPLPSPPSE